MSQGESSNPRPGQTAFFGGEGNPHPHGKPRTRRTIYPADLDVVVASVLALGAAPPGASTLYKVARAEAELNTRWPGRRRS